MAVESIAAQRLARHAPPQPDHDASAMPALDPGPSPSMTVRQFGAQVIDPFSKAERLLCSFSCGVTSAVATKRAIEINDGRLPVTIMYLETRSEHPDNARFRRECEEWFGHPTTGLGSQKYKDIWDVFARERFIAGPVGAKCTTVLKKQVAEKFERVSDLHVFGFEHDRRQIARAERLWTNQPEIMGWFPLIDARITKDDAKQIVTDAGIALPKMYDLGFDNNNCIGCPKGGNAYWNKIRQHFPDVFDRMVAQARELDVKLIKLTENGVRRRAYLDELPPGAIDDVPVDMSCGVICQQPGEG